MNRYLQSALVAALGMASVTCALAQENPSPPPPAAQAPLPETGTQPSTTTPSPERQAAASSKDTQKQAMKDCVTREQADNTGMSASQAKKACKQQMKAKSY